MASKNLSKSWKGGLRARLVIPPLSSWKTRAVLVAIVVATAGGAIYWFRDPAMKPLGLGILPVAMWLAVLLWALDSRRSWFHRHNMWLGSLALVALALGIMAFFQSSSGALAGFTLDGEVALGGKVGEAIIGSGGFLGALRLLGIFVAGVAVTAPPLAVDAAVGLGRLAVYSYVLSVVVARGIVRVLPLDRGPRTQEPMAEPNMPPEVLSPYTRLRTVLGVGAAAEEDYEWKPEGLQFEGPVPGTPEIPEAPLDTAAQSQSESARIVSEQHGEGEAADTAVDERTGSPEPAIGRFNRFWKSSDSTPEPEQEAEGDVVEDVKEEHEAVPESTMAAVTQEWVLPTTDLLLDVPVGGITEDEMSETAETIRRTLAEYGIEVELGQIRPGPTVTMYGLIPGWVRRYKQVREKDDKGRPKLDESGRPLVTQEESKTRVKVDSILSREKDLALALKTPSIRISTPVMGKSQVGIEIPNPNPSLVTLRSVMESEEFQKLRAKALLPVALGKGSGGQTVVIDLAKMPHLLIAGATGSGKSVCINTIVSCLIMQKTPAELRLLLIDPKRVELTPYNGIPHLLTSVVVETDQVVGLLKGTIREMLDRYRRFEELGVRNIEAYNEKMSEKMPFLVVGIDELADLMMSASFDVEQSLCRLAQLGRATGIHLIVATQRPSVDVVTGLIKANFPSRLSFGVSSQVDSRTILDTAGAEKLLGRGDMLYLPLDASMPVRAQNVFISDGEIENLVNSWQAAPRGPLASIQLRSVEDDRGDDEHEQETGDNLQDELLGKAIELAHSYAKLSTSLLQRRLRIGYPRAARLMDDLEEQGIVGPSDGSKSRDVIISGM